MASYVVSFFKNVLSSNGHQRKCLQHSFKIRRSKSIDRAIEAAKRRYQRLRHIPDWRLHADGIELEINDADPGVGRSGQVHSRKTAEHSVHPHRR